MKAHQTQQKDRQPNRHDPEGHNEAWNPPCPSLEREGVRISYKELPLRCFRIVNVGRPPAFQEGPRVQQAKEMSLIGNESGPIRLITDAKPGTVGYSTTHTVQFLAVLTIFPDTLPNKNSSL